MPLVHMGVMLTLFFFLMAIVSLNLQFGNKLLQDLNDLYNERFTQVIGASKSPFAVYIRKNEPVPTPAKKPVAEGQNPPAKQANEVAVKTKFVIEYASPGLTREFLRC